MQASDKKLVQQIQAGDSAAFEVLFNRYQGQVRSRLLRIVNDVATAEDLMQEAFLRVWNRSSQWNGEGPFPAWLQRIATNLAISHLRRVRRRREQSFEMAPGPLDEEGESPPEWLVEASDPGPELTLDQLGLPEEMAWMLFGPQVAQQLNDSQAVEQRTAAAAQKLDALMADAWVLFFGGHNFLHGTPPVPATSIIAFRPVRTDELVVRIHPQICGLTEVDFDGDHAMLILPLTEAAQEEAGMRLSLAGHLEHREDAWGQLFNNYHGVIWGLVHLSLDEADRGQLSELLGGALGEQILTKNRLTQLLFEALERDGSAKTRTLFEEVVRRGFAASKTSGASVSPFPATGLPLPKRPDSDDPDLWQIYRNELIGVLDQHVAFDDDQLGPFLLLKTSGARGNEQQIMRYVGGIGVIRDLNNGSKVIYHSLSEGLEPEEVFACAFNMWRQMATSNQQWISYRQAPAGEIGDYQIFGRALRAAQPGIVFARAADQRQADPLSSDYARLFAGVPFAG